MSDDNKIHSDLSKPPVSHETSVHAKSSHYPSEKRGAYVRIERSTVPYERKREHISLDALTYYPNSHRTSSVTAAESSKRFGNESANLAWEAENNDPEVSLSYGDVITRPDAEK